MRKIMALALALLPVDAVAADLAGRWNVKIPENPGYEGVVLIDNERRVVLKAPLDNGKPADFVGYVKMSDIPQVQMLLTDKKIVSRIDCLAETDDMLRCRTTFANGQMTRLYVMQRVGAAPKTLLAPH